MLPFADGLLRQIKAAFMDPWIDFTPTLSQGGNVAITVDYARYKRMGKTALVQTRKTVAASGVAGNAIVLTSLPAAIAPLQIGSLRICGHGILNKGGTVNTFEVAANTAAQLVFWNNGATNFLGINPAVTLSTGDVLSLALAYEIAA